MRMNDILILTSVDFRDFFNFSDFWKQKKYFFSHFSDFCIINEDTSNSLDIAFLILKEWSNNENKINEYLLQETNGSVCVVKGEEKLELGLIDIGLLNIVKKQYQSTPYNQICILILMYIIDELQGENWPWIIMEILNIIPGDNIIAQDLQAKSNGKTLISFFDQSNNDEVVRSELLRKMEEKMPPTVINLTNTSEYRRVYNFRRNDESVDPYSSRSALQSNGVYIDLEREGSMPIRDLKLQTLLQSVNCVNLKASKTEDVIWEIVLPALNEKLCITNEGRMIKITKKDAEEIAKGATSIAVQIDKYRIRNNKCTTYDCR